MEVAGGVVSFISLSFQLFEGCVKGFILLSAAQGYGSRAEICCCQLEWQQYHLHRWAALAGLFKQPPELNVPNLPLVERTLRNLEQILTNADKLETDYGLKVEITDDEVLEVQNSKRLFNVLRLPTSTARDFVSEVAKVYQRRASPWQKFKWAAFNQAKFEHLIRDVQFFNEQLLKTLHWTEQGQYMGSSNEVLRSMITQTTDKALLEVVTQKLENLDSAIRAAARLKQKSLLLDMVEESTAMSLVTRSSSPSMFLPSKNSSKRRTSQDYSLKQEFKDLQRLQTGEIAYHEIAKFKEATVLLEWKRIPPNMERRLSHRVAAVAELLSDMEDPAFHSLRCIGYLKEPKSSRYAYIFEPPVLGEFSMRTLQDLFQDDTIRPSVNQRVVLATALLETVLQLHTAGWLHKSIRSDNVLFFFHQSSSSNHDLPCLYLGGYGFARADSVLETTEGPTSYESFRLYRHPLSLSEDRMPFCKAFDLYSLGCVLLEIGLWRSLETMVMDWTKRITDSIYQLPPRSVKIEPKTSLEWYSVFEEKETFLSSARAGTVAEELRFCMGEIYARHVALCLDATSSSDDPRNDGEESTGLDNTFDILTGALQNLAAMLMHI